jgi:hypothetical protein
MTMSALPLHAPVLQLASRSVPEPLRALFRRARLGEPPLSIREVHLDTDHGAGATKILLSFQADRGELNLFQLLSPALQGTDPTRLEDGPALRLADEADDPIPAEVDHPWWCPDACGPGRRFAYSTPDLDFVEVIIDDLADRVFLRAIA